MQGIEEPTQVIYRQIGEKIVHESPVTGKRPGKTGQCHDEQKQCTVKAQSYVTVVPKTTPAFRTRYLQAVLQCTTVPGKPNY